MSEPVGLALGSFLTVAGFGVGLAMDAVAVSVAGGLAKQPLGRGDPWRMALVFGGFQALMPLIGSLVGSAARTLVAQWSPWIAAALLLLIGGKMLWEARKDDDDDGTEGRPGDPFAWGTLLVTGVATSIDALAVGVTLSLVELPVLLSCLLIGLITGVLCWFAVRLGSRLGSRWSQRAEVLGGLVLTGLGVRFLIQGLMG